MCGVRSIIYGLLFYIWTAFLAFLYLPLLVLPRKMMVRGACFWLMGVHFLLRHVIGLDYEVRGAENCPRQAVLIAAKHQSAFETLTLHLLLQDPVFILKRELTWVPFFGWYLLKVGVIAIDRGAQTKALKQMKEGALKALEQNRPVVVFPEGTRSHIDAKQPYHSGIAFLYTHLNVPVVPLALNSGLYWGRRSVSKQAGRVIFQYLKPIPSGLERKDFMNQLQNSIESATDSLVAEARQYQSNECQSNECQKV